MANKPNAVEKEKRGLLWWSTPESAEEGRFTVLALVETVLATCILLGIVVYTGNFKLILFPAVVVPLLLLRTKESMELGLVTYFKRVFNRLESILEPLENVYNGGNLALKFLAEVVFFCICIFVFGPLVLVVKIYVTFRILLSHPLNTVSSIPRNWWRISMATDLHHPPELLPGSEGHQVEAEEDIRFSRVFEGVVAPKDIRVQFLSIIFLPLIFFPPLLYRWSLKSTAILYLPILWILQPLSASADSAIQRLKLFVKSDMIRVVAAFSAVGISLFAAKLFLLGTWDGFAEWVVASPVGQVLDVYIQAAIVPRWQLVMFFNSCLMIVIFLFIRSRVRRYEVGAVVSEGVAVGVLKWGTIVRRVLTTYTMVCMFYLTAVEAMDWDLPVLGSRWVPWG